MIDNKLIFKNIEKLGEGYYNQFLQKYENIKLADNWWEALKFFFNRSFMRGRSDDLSIKYIEFTLETLKEHFSINEQNINHSFKHIREKKDHLQNSLDLLELFKEQKKLGKKNCASHKDFKKELAEKSEIITKLKTEKKTTIIKGETSNEKDKEENMVYLGNDMDLIMVLSTLIFISSSSEKKNIFSYIKTKLENQKIEEAYWELREIQGVGDKIASLILRDIILLNPEINVENQYVNRAFPIDTWVIQSAEKIGITGKKNEIRDKLIEKCINYGLDPLKFASGLWFLGFDSFRILVENYLNKYPLE